MTGILNGPALLFCPGDRVDRFERAASSADAVILDLEDGIAATSKDRARQAVAGALIDGLFDAGRCIVRVNPIDSPWGQRDIDVLRDSPTTTVMLPKACDPRDVEALAPWSVVALCETAAGVLAAPELARVDNCVGLMWGGEDLTADLGGRSSRGPDGAYLPLVTHARMAILLAAGAAGRPALDGVYLNITDTEGLATESEEAVSMGFSAKVAIHPTQVPHIRAAFAPTPAQVEWANEVLAALDAAPGVTTVRGQMVDEPILRHASAILASHNSRIVEPHA